MTEEKTATTGAKAPRQPSKRNALMVWALPTLCFVLAPPLGNFLGQTAFRMAPSMSILVGTLFLAGTTAAAIAELNTAAGSALSWWHLFIPIYGIYWAVVLVPAQMRVAKEKAKKPAARGGVLYFFLFLYALAADLNDLAES